MVEFYSFRFVGGRAAGLSLQLGRRLLVLEVDVGLGELWAGGLVEVDWAEREAGIKVGLGLVSIALQGNLVDLNWGRAAAE